MSNYVKFDHADIQAIIGLIDEIPPEERTEQEDIVMDKARKISSLQRGAAEKEYARLLTDPETGRLTIVKGKECSEPVPYKGIAKLHNYFAVTAAWGHVFPAGVLLKFMHANPAERAAFLREQRKEQVLSGTELEEALSRKQ
ncbi:MAG: hypothetical protein KGI50_06755 [Patescibacteria group bacterium]|nr:hypothetical protein [Patescibacteria group bacterium]